MKHILYLLLSFTLATFVVRGQEPPAKNEKKQAVTPPAIVLEKFKNSYPEITPEWKLDGKNYVAEFIDPETLKGIRLLYDKDGNVLRKESEMDNSSYPQSINDYYIKKYPGEKYKTWSSVDQSGVSTYFIQRGSEIIRFDGKGQYVKP